MLANLKRDRIAPAGAQELDTGQSHKADSESARSSIPFHPHVLSTVVMLDSTHKDLLFRHYLRLDATARRQRFGAKVAEQSIRRHADRAGSRDRLLVGLLADHELRGVAEFVCEGPSWKSHVHAAISVDQAYRSAGIGSLLFRRGLSAMRARGVSRVIVTCTGQNEAMVQLLKNLGAKICFDGGDLVAAVSCP